MQQTAQVPVLRVSSDIELLPDLRGWTNRLEIRSESSNSVYIVSQNIEKRHWGCSCMGWITRRNCKHLKALGLPGDEVPHEVKLVKQ